MILYFFLSFYIYFVCFELLLVGIYTFSIVTSPEWIESSPLCNIFFTDNMAPFLKFSFYDINRAIPAFLHMIVWYISHPFPFTSLSLWITEFKLVPCSTFICWSPNPKVMVFGGVLWELIKYRWGPGRRVGSHDRINSPSPTTQWWTFINYITNTEEPFCGFSQPLLPTSRDFQGNHILAFH